MNEMEPLKAWFSLAAVVISVATSIWMFFQAPSKKTATDLQVLDARVSGEMKTLLEAVSAIASRTQTLESELKHLPDAKAFMEMRLAISELSGKLGRMEESQISTSRTVLQVQDFLMKSNAA